MLEQAKPVQVLPPDTALCLMNRKIFRKGKMTDRHQPETSGQEVGRASVTAASWGGGLWGGRGWKDNVGSRYLHLHFPLSHCCRHGKEIGQRRQKNATSTEQR